VKRARTTSGDPRKRDARLPVAARLVEDLRAAGGGELAGQPRSVLDVLGTLARRSRPHARITVDRLAFLSAYSTRTIRRALSALESLALIEWERGRIVAGHPVKGRVFLDVERLAAMVIAAGGRK